MKKFTVLALTAIMLMAVSAFAKDATVTGWITDPACGATHDKAKMSDSACAKKCAAKDGKLVIVTDKDNKVWAIDNVDAVQGHEGHHVKVTGTPNADAGTIHIATVSMMKDASSKKDKAMDK